MIVQSNGGVMAVDTACRLPVRTALSGPAAGVIAAGYIARSAGFDNVITGDMGGTSFDVSLIAEGQSMLSPQTSIDFGMVVRTPMIEITTIGAGGGSIAWVDKGGLLNIGPESAGSDPGPVAYGLGNDRPDGDRRQCGAGTDRPGQPHRRQAGTAGRRGCGKAIDDHVGTPLGLTTVEAAEAILRVANAAWPAPSAWSASSAGLTRNALRSCPLAAAVRCMPAPCWPRSASRAPWCRAIPA